MKCASLPYKLFNCGDRAKMECWFNFLSSHPGIDGIELQGMSAGAPWDLVVWCRDALARVGRPVSMMIPDRGVVDAGAMRDPRSKPAAARLDSWAMAMLQDLDLAEFLDVSLVRFLGAPGWNPSMFECGLETLVEASAQVLERVLPQYRARGVRIAIENHPSDVSGDKRYFDLLFQRLPDPTLGVNFDFLNSFAYPGQHPEAWLSDERITSRMLYAHVTNGHRFEAGIEKGGLAGGIEDVKDLPRRLKATGYDGWLSFEYAGQDLEEAERSVSWLKRTWESV